MLIAGEESDLGFMDMAPEPGLSQYSWGSNLHSEAT